MTLPKVKCGDVFRLQAPNGICFIQCVKESVERESEKIRVLPGVYSPEVIANMDMVINKKELFFSELPLKYALRKKLALPVGNYPIPTGSEVPRFYRVKHKTGDGVVGWHIVDLKTFNRKFVTTLSDEEVHFSPSYMMSVPDIIERIENNWTPLEWI